MNGCQVEVEYAGDSVEGIRRATGWLTGIGYEIKSQSEASAKLKFNGKWITADPEKMRHYVEITAAGDKLRFDFGTGLVASVWTDSDIEWAQSRARQSLA